MAGYSPRNVKGKTTENLDILRADSIEVYDKIMIRGETVDPGGGGVTLPINISDVTNLQTELDSKAETDIGLTLTNQAYSGNLAGATNQKEANDLIDALVIGGGGGTIQNANLSIQAADEGTVAGNARGNNAVDLQTNKLASTAVASGSNSVITGGRNNKAAGTYSCVGGGFGNEIISQSSVISGGFTNVIDGDYSVICGGNANYIDSNGTRGVLSGGQNNSVRAGYGVVMGGYNIKAHIYAQSLTGGFNTSSSKYRFPSECTLQLTTTSATTNQIMYISSTNRIDIPTNTSYSVIVTIKALDTTNNANSSTFRVIGDLLNNGGTVTWAQEANPITVTQGSGCGTITVSADNTNKALQVDVSPNSANTIIWQAKVELVEVQE